MDQHDRPPITPQRRLVLLAYALMLGVAMTVLVTAGWLPIASYVLGIVLVLIGIGFVLERAWALRLGQWAATWEQRRQPRPRWQTVLLVVGLTVVVALIVSG